MNRRIFLIAWLGSIYLLGSVRAHWARGENVTTSWQQALFDDIDLSAPELKAVRAAVDRHDLAQAQRAWAAYLRQRASVPWTFAPAASRPANSIDRVAEDAADGTVIGGLVQVPHTFPDNKIDWVFNATVNQPGIAVNYEWQWQLCRMEFWNHLASAYRATADERYAEAWVKQFRSFADQCPPPDRVQNGIGSPWRTIECGIRASGSWPDALMSFRSSPSVTDEDLAHFSYLFDAQGRYLHSFPSRGNWLTMEMSGLYTTGSLFPELKQAGEWRTYSAEQMKEQETAQFLPDGAQFELSPAYHNVALDNLSAIPRIAKRMGRLDQLPAGYVEGLEKAFEFDLNLMTPDRILPKFNDSWPVSVPSELRRALDFFPGREDFRWIASDGAQGTVPQGTSKEFAWAGFYAMRTGWERDANCLIFRAGPLGFGHCHQDKLSVVLWPYGRELLFDDGGGSYEKSERRQYDTSTFAHNTVIVDGKPQMRQTADRDANVSKLPIDSHWQSTPAYDFAQGVYDDGYGSIANRIATHTRRVLLIKPDLFIIADTLAPVDSAEHTYQARWNLFTTKVTQNKELSAITTNDAGQPNLAVVPLRTDGLDVKAVSAQTDPEMLGWYIIKDHVPPFLPAITVLQTIHGAGVQGLLTLLLPLKTGDKLPVTAVKNASNRAVVVEFDDGRKITVTVDPAPSGGIEVGETLRSGKGGRHVSIQSK